MRNSEKSIPVIISSFFAPSFTTASFASPAVNFKYLHKCILVAHTLLEALLGNTLSQQEECTLCYRAGSSPG